jgi:3-hydroxyisobutyrate dehydrogenase-like beta-hydroxyacid dehydrogenase
MVILVLTGPPQVEAVLTGAGGLLQGLNTGTVVIDCTTAISSSTRLMAQAVQAAGGRFLDSPMTRTPKKKAAEGRLNLLVGGYTEVLHMVMPLLNGAKDLCYYQQMASDAGAAQRIAAAVLGTMELAAQSGPAGALMPQLVALLEQRTD